MTQGPRFRFCLQISTPVTVSVRPNSYCQVSEEWEGARLASQPPESPLEEGGGGVAALLLRLFRVLSDNLGLAVMCTRHEPPKTGELLGVRHKGKEMAKKNMRNRLEQ